MPIVVLLCRAGQDDQQSNSDTVFTFISNVTLEHKTSIKSLGYICISTQKYIVWDNIFILSQKSLGYEVKIMFHEDICKCITEIVSNLIFD